MAVSSSDKNAPPIEKSRHHRKERLRRCFPPVQKNRRIRRLLTTPKRNPRRCNTLPHRGLVAASVTPPAPQNLRHDRHRLAHTPPKHRGSRNYGCRRHRPRHHRCRRRRRICCCRHHVAISTDVDRAAVTNPATPTARARRRRSCRCRRHVAIATSVDRTAATNRATLTT